MDKNVCVTIGNFDGVHLGHLALLQAAQNKAKTENLDLVVVTFWPHPREVLAAGHLPLTSRDLKLALLREAGVERLLELKFTPEMANLSAEEFIGHYLEPMGLRQMVVGHDFTLGKRRGGTLEVLNELGNKWNFQVTQIPALVIDGGPVSSTRLRGYLREGKVAEAARLLGRWHAIAGHVTHGAGRGHGLGFPTANLAGNQTIFPADGVYATFLTWDGKKYQAVTNIGYNPTFQGSARSIESFLLDANLNLYDRDIQVEFVEKLRGEKKFPNPAELSAQIGQDVEKARAILAQAAI